MDLPTYTSIWRIEKRLYKLYDFRLPMPLPIGQITVFTAIAVPYVVLLTVLGLPFNHTLIWLYVLPPGVLTWLATRPVLESKRLPELIRSQLRYLAEPRVWCRMAPLSERDVIVVIGRVWRPSRSARHPAASPARPGPGRRRRFLTGVGRLRASAVAAAGPVIPRGTPPPWARDEPDWTSARKGAPPSAWAPGPPAGRPHAPTGRNGGASPARPAGPPASRPARPEPPAQEPSAVPEPAAREPAAQEPAAQEPAAREPAVPAPHRPVVTVVGAGIAHATPPVVERAIAGPSARRGDARPGRVTVVPGGYRPGKPDQLNRDRSRAQQPIGGPSRVVVLGCTVGAGQTVTALLTGEVLASLRTDQVAVLDLNPGASSLARRSQARPALSQAASLVPSRLTILGSRRTPDRSGASEAGQVASGQVAAGQGATAHDPARDARTLLDASERADIVLADPATASVPRLLAVADQLVLVAPASAAAAGAIAMTFEWLEAHGQADLAAGAIMVMNGVSRRSTAHIEQAERVCVGRCRAIVRVPWDDQLNSQNSKRAQPAAPGSSAHQHWAGVLTPATVAAYTALAGVLVAALADREPDHEPPGVPGHAHDTASAGLRQVRR